MNYTLLYMVLGQIVFIYCVKKPIKYQIKESPHYANANFYKDRIKETPHHATLPPYVTKAFHPAWMDYCDPYHCNDYHKLTCGLNRKTGKFKWFQSGCHIILNNKCATYRGFLTYIMVDVKYCYQYVMFFRDGCSEVCDDETLDPVCGVSVYDKHVVMFKNECAFNAANCRSETFQEYKQVDKAVCSSALNGDKINTL